MCVDADPMRRSQPLSALVVGAGVMGRWHAEALIRAGVRLVGVADRDLVRARSLAHRHHGCAVGESLGELLTRTSADLVSVCTPTHSHLTLIGESLAAGLHVLAEKPLAEDAPATATLLRVAASQGCLLCPVHQFVYQRGVQAAASALPALGSVRHVEFLACSAGAEGSGDAARRQIAADILPHPLALLARLVPGALADLRWRTIETDAGELCVFKEAGQATVALRISMGGRPTRNELRIIGDNGTIRVDLFHGFSVRQGGAVSRSRKIAGPFSESTRTLLAAAGNLARRVLDREPAYPGLRELVARFAHAVRNGGPAPISPEETLAVAAARDAILGHATPQSPQPTARSRSDTSP